MTLRYLSVCSGIEAASVAWEPLGWKPIAYAEIEKFPSAVLKYRWPHVSNIGGEIDVLVGGTPCQSFSVAGLRGGLNDERGNLALEFVRIADESDPAFIIWENVPGIFSDGGNAFGCFLAALAGEDAPLLPPGGRWTYAGYVLGTRRTIAWVVRDAQYFGLAQRRKRVFLIGCPRNGADPRKILFEFGGMRRDSAPGREARADVAGTVKGGSGNRGWQLGAEEAAAGHVQITQALTGRLGDGGPDDNKAQGGFYVADIAPTLRAGGNSIGGNRPVGTDVDTCESLVGYVPEIVSQAISCKWSKGTSDPAGDEHYNLVATANVEVSPTVRAGGNATGGNRPMGMDVDTCESLIIASVLRGEGFYATEDGTGRQNLMVTPINTQVGLRHKALGERTGLGVGNPGDPAFTLQRGHSHAVCVTPPLTGNQYGDHESREGLLVPVQSPGTVLAFDTTQITSPHNHSNPHPGDPCHPVSARAHPPAIAFHGSQEPDVSGDVTHPCGRNGGRETCVAFAQNQCGEIRIGEISGTLNQNSNPSERNAPLLQQNSAVRRLTPTECERLQGFPDGYTEIPWRGKAAYECPDGPRYKALGNSMAVPVMHWIGMRIERYLRENANV